MNKDLNVRSRAVKLLEESIGHMTSVLAIFFPSDKGNKNKNKQMGPNET